MYLFINYTLPQTESQFLKSIYLLNGLYSTFFYAVSHELQEKMKWLKHGYTVKNFLFNFTIKNGMFDLKTF